MGAGLSGSGPKWERAYSAPICQAPTSSRPVVPSARATTSSWDRYHVAFGSLPRRVWIATTSFFDRYHVAFGSLQRYSRGVIGSPLHRGAGAARPARAAQHTADRARRRARHICAGLSRARRRRNGPSDPMCRGLAACARPGRLRRRLPGLATSAAGLASVGGAVGRRRRRCRRGVDRADRAGGARPAGLLRSPAAALRRQMRSTEYSRVVMRIMPCSGRCVCCNDRAAVAAIRLSCQRAFNAVAPWPTGSDRPLPNRSDRP